MTTVQDIYDNLCALAPVEKQMSFDNAGFLLGHSDAAVNKVLLSLDITGKVISEAENIGAQLIVSHHPIIFTPVRSVTDSVGSRKILRMAEDHIAAICMHTNLDIAEGGVNDVLISLLGAVSEAPLDAGGCGRIGMLEGEMSLFCFLIRVKKRLKTKGLRFYDAGKQVRKIAVMGGSGGDCIEEAAEKGCDTYVTADIKYHQFLSAAELGINLVDAGHFCTENPIIPVLAKRLSKDFPDVSFTVSKVNGPIIDFA